MKRTASLVMCLVLALSVFAPPAAHAQEQKVVRVGWYDSTYCYVDTFGRRSGIAYEYQQKIAAYTGWTYEYVEGSWPELLRMLEAGELDLLSDVSYTEKRADTMLFSSLAMGSESYYIYANADNSDINPEDLRSFNGKRIGVNQGSVQESILHDWMQRNKITPEIVPLTESVEDSIRMLTRGEIDAYTTLDNYGAETSCIPVCKIGSSDYFFAVNKRRPDLLGELNAAMGSIQDDDAYFNQKMFEKYIHAARTNAFLAPATEQWLARHGAIRVGYRDGYLPFCGRDEETGEFTGALKNYLAHASNCIRNVEIQFEAIPYPSTADALDAMSRGEVDCVFPVNFSLHDAETMNLLIGNKAMQAEMYAVVRAANREDVLAADQAITVALTSGNTNYETFLRDRFPSWQIVPYPSDEECFRAVAAGAADCLLVSSYRINEVAALRERYKLSLYPTGEMIPFSFAVARTDRELYSVLNKIANLTPEADVNSYLASYANRQQKITLRQFLKENLLGVILFITVIFFAILFLLLKKLEAERKASAKQRQIESERMEHQRRQEEALRKDLRQQEQLAQARELAYTDPLTGVSSKHAYVESEQQMDRRIADGTVLEFGIGIFDLNDLKKVNDTMGHDAGDKYITEACKCLRSCFRNSTVYRIGGDEFSIILESEDYTNRDALLGEFDRQMEENAKQGLIVVSAGLSCFVPGQDNSFRTVFERADQKMYARKKQLKEISAARRAKG